MLSCAAIYVPATLAKSNFLLRWQDAASSRCAHAASCAARGAGIHDGLACGDHARTGVLVLARIAVFACQLCQLCCIAALGGVGQIHFRSTAGALAHWQAAALGAGVARGVADLGLDLLHQALCGRRRCCDGRRHGRCCGHRRWCGHWRRSRGRRRWAIVAGNAAAGGCCQEERSCADAGEVGGQCFHH